MLTSYYEVRCLFKCRDRRAQERWNMLRWGVFHTIWAIPGKKASWPKSVERMFPMPWDVKREVEVPKVTPEEENLFFEIMANYKKNKK